MDPRLVKALMDVKLQNVFPEGLSSHHRFVVKRRAETFRIKEEADKLFKEFPCSRLGGHVGVEKTHGAIMKRLVEDIRTRMPECPQCQSERARIKERRECTPIEVTEPLELLGRTSWVNYNLCERLGIERSLCSPYHPQTNGLVEKLNGTIQRSLNKLVAGEPKRWDQFLQPTMFSLKTKTQLTTKEARDPSAGPKEYKITEDKVEREDVWKGLQKQEAVFTLVKKNILKSQERVRQRKLEKGQADNLQVRDNPRHTGREEEGDAMAKYGLYKVYSENFMVLAPGQQLEGEIINAYLSWVGAKAGAFIFDSYLITSLWQGTHKGGLRKLDLTKHNVAAGAICYRAHWTLIIMSLRENRSHWATKEQISRCKDLTRSLVRKTNPAVGRWACDSMDPPKQQDTASCDDLSQLCRACGELSSGFTTVDQWSVSNKDRLTGRQRESLVLQ
ncbi:hypothetical protein KUCAC02_004306, partial [Chaenocephalus aceratus]